MTDKKSAPEFKASHKMKAYPYSEIMVTLVGLDFVYFTDALLSKPMYMSNDDFARLYESLEVK